MLFQPFLCQCFRSLCRQQPQLSFFVAQHGLPSPLLAFFVFLPLLLVLLSSRVPHPLGELGDSLDLPRFSSPISSSLSCDVIRTFRFPHLLSLTVSFVSPCSVLESYVPILSCSLAMFSLDAAFCSASHTLIEVSSCTWLSTCSAAVLPPGNSTGGKNG